METAHSRPQSLWKNADFLKFWCGQTISEIGSHITRDGLPLLAVLTAGRDPAADGAALGRGQPAGAAGQPARRSLGGPAAAAPGDDGRGRRPGAGAADRPSGALPGRAAHRAAVPGRNADRGAGGHLRPGLSRLSALSCGTRSSGGGQQQDGLQRVGRRAGRVQPGGHPGPAADRAGCHSGGFLSFLASLLGIAAIRKPSRPGPGPRSRRSARNCARACALSSPVRCCALAFVESTHSFFGSFFGVLYSLYTIRDLGLTLRRLG